MPNAGRRLREDDGADHAQPLGERAAGELAGRAAREHEHERHPDRRHRRALGDEQEGQEREEGGARRVVDDVHRGQGPEAAQISDAPAAARAAGPRPVACGSVAPPACEPGEDDDHQHRGGQPEQRVAARGLSPADPGGDEDHGGRHHHLAEVAREVVRAERHPPGRRSRRRCETSDEESGMLYATSRARRRSRQREEARESAGRSRGEEAQRGDGGAGGEESRLAPTLGEDAGRDLEPRHAAAVHALQERPPGRSSARTRRSRWEGARRRCRRSRRGRSGWRRRCRAPRGHDGSCRRLCHGWRRRRQARPLSRTGARGSRERFD